MTPEEAERLLGPLANFVFTKAVRDGRAGEVLYHLFDGGGVTINPYNRDLVLIASSMMSDAIHPEGT